ncbi:MAG: hypothetical protein WB565_05285, partial [Acidimicrobiales bacterium]
MTSHAQLDQSGHGTGQLPGVSGAVVHVLIDLVRRRAGEIGVAQALALADDHRTFSDLDDFERWSSFEEGVRLFNAAALVTGDEAVGLHVGERLLSTADGSDFVERLRATGSPEEVFAEVGDVLAHFESASQAVALEVESDHALIKVSPLSSRPRHAHLCEMTKGILASVPTLFGMPAALLTEHECCARGGRACLYALSWDDGSKKGVTEVVSGLDAEHGRESSGAWLSAMTPAAPERRENGTFEHEEMVETEHPVEASAPEAELASAPEAEDATASDDAEKPELEMASGTAVEADEADEAEVVEPHMVEPANEAREEEIEAVEADDGVAAEVVEPHMAEPADEPHEEHEDEVEEVEPAPDEVVRAEASEPEVVAPTSESVEPHMAEPAEEAHEQEEEETAVASEAVEAASEDAAEAVDEKEPDESAEPLGAEESGEPAELWAQAPEPEVVAAASESVEPHMA